ncbi:formylglycine-generating enzyme family protein [Rhizobium leguminosarum]|nr:formylglycine-generating enzyme family protein [Rhizobium leguminosarum]
MNSDGIPVAAFNLHGSSKYAKTALIYCGGDNTAIAAAGTVTAEAGGTVVSAETVSSPAASSDAGAGKAFRDCEHCPEMVPLPLGAFMMGASQKEMKQLKYVQWATPQHQVSIGYPFAIGRFEITVDEFDAYVKETGVHVGGKCGIRTIESGPNKFKYNGTLVQGGDKTENAPYVIYIGDGSYAQPGLPVTGRLPAVCISRNEMKDYLDWLSIKANKHYRLPTEAEWEYAYRAGTDTFNYWGNDFKQTCDYANFADRKSGYQAGMAASCSEKMQPDWTAEVGSYKPNQWGLYDMGGNAQEAVEDCFHKSYQDAPADGSPWTEPDCVLFAARSGDYELTQFSMRASERLIFGYSDGNDDGMWTRDEGSDERFNGVGFRVAVSLDDKSWDKMAGAAAPEKQADVQKAAVASPATEGSGLQYGHLPPAVKSYVENVRNSCRDSDPNGIPSDKMSGIRPISLPDGTIALLIENETVCSDHYSSANCSNRGCDVVVMTEGDGGWKEIFHEHLYDDTFDIGDDKKLNSISASIYAGDPHCDPAQNAKFMSSDSCNVVIHYENKHWVWRKTRSQPTSQVTGDQIGTDTAPSTNESCGGSYVFVQLVTFLYDPLLGPKADREALEAKGEAASWYDVECDAAGRPAIFTRYQFGKKTGMTGLEYEGQTSHVARQVDEDPDGKILSTSVIARDAKMRPASIEVRSENGEAEKIGLFSYQDGHVDLNISAAKDGAALWHAREWFDDSGALRRAYWYYPKFWYDYHYDPRTGLYPSHDKYDDDLKFATTDYEYDEFGNTLSRRSTCIVDACDTVTSFAKFDHGHLAHEEAKLKSGDELVWENEYDAEGRLAASRLSANGHFVIKFVVKRDGTLVKQTVAYSPKGKKLFVYDRAETVYITRDGSPVNGGKYKRFTKHNVW